MTSPVFTESQWRAAKNLPQLLVAMIIMMSLLGLPLFSQNSQGTIQGSVFDQTGGAIAGATVTIIDVARGANRVLTSDGAGEYLANNLNPSTYTVRAEAKGFRTEEHTGVLLEVGQNVRVDLVVQPGEQTQTVTVTGEVPAIDTTDATLGGALSNQEITALPLNGRNFERLIQLRPGVITGIGGSPRGSSTNGRRSGNDILIMEGIPQFPSSGSGSSTLSGFSRSGDGSSLVSIDAIQEFNTSNITKAEYGWKDGGVINVGIKSGTNTIHGTAFAFGRNAAATDAANWATGSVTPATLEQFGASAGGRIIKDKLFWFASFEGLRDTLGDTSVLNTPTSLPGLGDNVSMVDTCNALKTAGKTIAPLSALLAGLNTTTCTVTQASSSVENVFPYNTSTSASQNWVPGNHGVQTIGPLNNGMVKGDYNLGQHHHFSGVYFRAQESQLTNPFAGEALPQQQVASTNKAVFYDGAWTWTPNSTWLNDFRVGYTTVYDLTLPVDANLLASGAWPNGYGMFTGVAPFTETSGISSGGIPNIWFDSFGGGNQNTFELGSGNRQDLVGPEGDLALVESVSYLRGKHAFKFGFDYVDIIFDGSTFDQSQGQLQFNTLEDFLTGNVERGSILYGDPTASIRGHWYAGFVQDDWRITPRLTVNLGLRYEYDKSPVERNNYIGGFNPSVNPLTQSAVQQVGPGEPLPMFTPDKKGIMPRLGVAWDVKGNGKTVVRASGSIFRFTPVMNAIVGQQPFGANVPSIGVNTSGTNVNKFSITLTNPPVPGLVSGWQKNGPNNPIFTVPTLVVAGAPGNQNGTYTGLSCTFLGEAGLPAGYSPVPCATATVDPNFQEPGAVEWNLGIQRAITNNLTVDVEYVGNRGFDEFYAKDINQPPLGSGWNSTAYTQLPAATLAAIGPPGSGFNAGSLGGLSPAAYCMASAATAYNHCFKNGTTAAAITANELASAPFTNPINGKFPYLSNIIQLGNGMLSRYNALQITVNERTSHGLSFIAGYAYSHALDEYSGNSPSAYFLVPNEVSYKSIYGNSANDIRHRFTFTPSYQIPGIKSPGQMLQGWSLSGILVAQQGLPWNPNTATSGDFAGTGESGAQPNIGGAMQLWNFTGNRSDFTSARPQVVNGALQSGILKLTGAKAMTTCGAAATAPYAGNATLTSLALASLSDNGCYAQNGSILTPPAYSTALGDSGRNLFRAPDYINLDMSVAKVWTFKERYSAQFRMEFFNIFNRADLTVPSGTNPTARTAFGCSCATPDASNPVVGSGGPRHIQFALKLSF